MDRKIRDAIFFLMVFGLIFDNIPKLVQLNFLGGLAGSKLVVYPLLAGFLYSFYCNYKHGNVFVDFRKFARYAAVFVAVMLASTVVGLISYPYYDVLLNGPVDQIEKLPRVLDFLTSHGIPADEKFLMQCWVVARQVKGIFLETFWCFGTAYLVYCWYKEDWKTALKRMGQAILCSAVVLLVYSSVELFYLAHSDAAGKILSAVNPYIHEIKTDGKWWPPLLWKGQLRSVFSEPSYFGIYMAFAVPWLWYGMWKKPKISYMIATFFLVFCLVLTKSRTAFMLHVGELALLAVGCLLFERNKQSLWKLGRVAGISLCSFFLAMGFIGGFMDVTPSGGANHVAKNSVEKNNAPKKVAPKADVAKNTEKYIKSNAASLANPDARSNRARYSVMEADIKIGLDHPIMGVGRGLRDSYMSDYFSEKALQNGEVKMWLGFQKKLGLMRSGIPPLGEYTSRFSSTGLLGLGVFLAPVIILVMGIRKKIRVCEDKSPYMILLVALGGVLASGIGDSINIIYGYWLLLGLAYAVVFGKSDETENVQGIERRG